MLEYVVDPKKLGAKTLFATHYHELTSMEESYDGIVNYHIAAKKRGDSITFLRKIVRGSTDDSYGIEVAKLAGVAGIYIVGKASAEGTLEPMHKCRGEKRSLEAIVADLKAEGFKGGRISIGHSQNEQAASRLKKMILSVFENASIEIHKLRGLCSFYAEKGGLLIGFEKE